MVNWYGKTTLVDIILGLLEPKKVKIDGQIITKQNVRSWQRRRLFLIFNIDDTIAANIALGIKTGD